MNSLWQIPAVVLVVLAWLASPPAGLTDIAQREAFRRSATPKAQATLTNLGLPMDSIPASAVSGLASDAPPATGDPAGAKPGDPAAKPGDPAAKDPQAKPDPPKDESYWRKKMSDLRATLEKNQQSAKALQARINALQADTVNIDDPLKQTKARIDLVRSLDELDKTHKQIATDEAAISALQNEARRSNVPAGWIR